MSYKHSGSQLFWQYTAWKDGRILYFKIVISWLCFLIVVLHYVKLRHSCVTFTSMRLRRMSMAIKRTRAVMFSVARFI